jgi:predicted DsbA family dithiol-disulfide isomerase
VSIQWKPYFLNPNIPPEGVDLKEYLSAKYGHEAVARFSSPDNPLDKAGENVGVLFNKNRRIVNTLNGHRLMEWCNQNDPTKSTDLMEAIFHAYFEVGIDVSKHEELLKIAESCNLDKESVRALLDSNLFAADVRSFDSHVKSNLDISGVPFFIIESNKGKQRPVVFSGAQVSIQLFMYI